MNENVISTFMNFKINCLKKYCKIIGKNLVNLEISDDFYNRYLNTYINTVYYHILGTVDYTDDLKYNQTTINKELEGIYEEIIYDIENSDLIESIDIYNLKKDQAKISYRLSLFITMFNKLEFTLDDDYNEFINKLTILLERNKRISELFTEDVYASLFEEVRNDLVKQNKYFNSLSDLDFSLVYRKFVSTKNYLIRLNHTIKRLQRNYKQTMVDRVYEFDSVSIPKIKTMINLVSMDILKRLLNKEKIGTYFIKFSEVCFKDKKTYEDILSLMDNSLIRKCLVIIVDNNIYNSHVSFFTNYTFYTYAVLVDMSHINDVEKKLDNLNTLGLFKYIIVDKVKNRDYDFIKKYEVDIGKELFFNRLKVE